MSWNLIRMRTFYIYIVQIFTTKDQKQSDTEISQILRVLLDNIFEGADENA